MLSEQIMSLLQDGCGKAFVQERSRVRAMELSLGTFCALGRRTLSRSICAIGRQHQDWSADYKVFSRSQWEPDRLFVPVLKEYRERYPDQPICLAFDDTKVRKSGRKIKSAFWQRDPLSPPFHVNFVYGLRFMHASLIFPHYRDGDFSARGYPVRFVECPAVKKPGKRASAEQIKDYKEAVKTHNLSRQGLEVIKRASQVLLQCYFDRWQIEVNHREEKDTMGVGNAQVWSAKSVPRQPAFAVASYSLLLLAGLKEFGPGRTHDFVPLPKWRKKAARPSALDLITLLRKEISETSVTDILKSKIKQNVLPYAYA